MKRRLFKLGTLPIGVDIGAGGVRLVQFAQRRRGLSLVASAHVPFLQGESSGESAGEPADLVSKILVDPAEYRELGHRIGKAAHASGFRLGQCVVALDDRVLRTRSVRMPPMSDAEVSAAAMLDASARLGCSSSEQVEADWLRAGEVRQGDETREELIYVGTAREPLEALLYTLAEHGLRATAVEPGFVACARALTWHLRREVDEATVRVILDIGTDSSGVMLTRGNRVVFYKPLEIGGSRMTMAAAERLGLDPGVAHELRCRRMLRSAGAEYGEPIDPKIDRVLFESARPIMNDLAHETKLCLRYYSVTFRGVKPSQCVVVGSDAREPRMTEGLSSLLNVETVVGDPLVDVDVSGSRGERSPSSSAPAWAVGAGLSMRALDLGRGQASQKRAAQRRARRAAAGSARGEAA